MKKEIRLCDYCGNQIGDTNMAAVIIQCSPPDIESSIKITHAEKSEWLPELSFCNRACTANYFNIKQYVTEDTERKG